MTIRKSTKDIEAENVFSDAVALWGKFNFSLSGTWVATVTLQKSYDSGTSWIDVDTATANENTVWEEPESGVVWRFGSKTGGFTSGKIVGRLSQ